MEGKMTKHQNYALVAILLNCLATDTRKYTQVFTAGQEANYTHFYSVPCRGALSSNTVCSKSCFF